MAEIRERPQPFAHSFELCGLPDAGEKFLADRPDQEGTFILYQSGKFDRPAINDSELASKYQ